MRTKLMAANWKMNKKAAEVEAFCLALQHGIASAAGHVDIVLAMPSTFLETAQRVQRQAPAWGLATQNVHWAEKGAFTGEISTAMLQEFGVSYAIVGHSERRQLFGETDETVAKRAEAALRAQIIPLICMGETLPERRQGRLEEVLSRQLGAVIGVVKGADPSRVVFAYEPVWAIGTGESASALQAQEVHAFIRHFCMNECGEAWGRQVRIVYGGSMTPDNCGELLQMPDIDGGLVGGASLDPERFAAMVLSAAKAT